MISWSIWALINRLIQQKKEWCKRSTTPHSICLRIQLHRYIVCINYYESVTVHNLMDVHLFVNSKATEAFFNWYICCCFHFRWPIIPFKFYSRVPSNNKVYSSLLTKKSLYYESNKVLLKNRSFAGYRIINNNFHYVLAEIQ